MVCRTSSSAAEVTVQVFNTTRSAPLRAPATSSPLAASCDSRAAPSACVARHPKFWTKYFPTVLLFYPCPEEEFHRGDTETQRKPKEDCRCGFYHKGRRGASPLHVGFS